MARKKKTEDEEFPPEKCIGKIVIDDALNSGNWMAIARELKKAKTEEERQAIIDKYESMEVKLVTMEDLERDSKKLLEEEKQAEKREKSKSLFDE